MNAEKFVKKEAKSALSGNWGVAVFSVLVLLFIPIVAFVIAEMSFVSLGDAETITEGIKASPINAALFFFFNIAAIVAFVLLSPLYNGFVRIFTSIADKKKTDPFDLFYFFESKKKYIDTLSFMVGVILKGLAILCLCEIIPVGVFIISDGEDAMVIFGILLAFVGAIVAFCIIHRFNFRVVLYSYYDYSGEDAARFGSQIAKRNTSNLVKLSGSFIPNLLLTFFVVPIIYIYPYMTCSYMLSTKYLIDSYKEVYGDFVRTAENVAQSGVDTQVSGAVFGVIPNPVQPSESTASQMSFNVSEEAADNTSESDMPTYNSVSLDKESDI